MKKTIPIILLALAVVSFAACDKKEERRPDFSDLGGIADNYKAEEPEDSDEPDQEYTHEDLQGVWNTTYNGQSVNVTIDFDAGEYSSDAEGTAPVELRLASEEGNKVTIKLTSPDGASSESIECVFINENTIDMNSETGISKRFKRVE